VTPCVYIWSLDCDLCRVTCKNMALADKNDKFTSFDSVDLLGAENNGTEYNTNCKTSNPEAEQNDLLCVLKSDDNTTIGTSGSVDCESNVDDVISSSLETVELSEKQDSVEANHCSLSTEVDERTDDIDGDHSLLTESHVSTSDLPSHSLSHEADNSDEKTSILSHVANDGTSLEMSSAVLALDSDADSPRHRKTYGDLDGDEGMEVDVAALHRHLAQVIAERDEYETLYLQSKEDNDNYQEQILEVWCIHAVL